MTRVNPHAAPSLSVGYLLRLIWTSRQLLAQLTRREIHARYRGSVLGVLWALLSPLLMLGVYTLIFSGVFQAHWANAPTAVFASVLFVGLCVFNLFSDVLSRSPRLILDHANYVKRVVFPLELLTLVNCLVTLFQFSLNILVLLAWQGFAQGGIPLTAVFLPLVVMPVLLLAAGASWWISALGVYLRDIAPIVTLLTMALMFLSPIFYSVDTLPRDLQYWFGYNPLALIIDQARAVLIWGNYPKWRALAGLLLGSGLFAWLGFCWFQLTKKGFADVL